MTPIEAINEICMQAMVNIVYLRHMMEKLPNSEDTAWEECEREMKRLTSDMQSFNGAVRAIKKIHGFKITDHKPLSGFAPREDPRA